MPQVSVLTEKTRKRFHQSLRDSKDNGLRWCLIYFQLIVPTGEVGICFLDRCLQIPGPKLVYFIGKDHRREER